MSSLYIVVRNVRGMHGEGVESYSLDIRTMRLNRTGLCHGVKVQYRQSLQCQCLLSHIVKLATNKRDRNKWFRGQKSKSLPNSLDIFSIYVSSLIRYVSGNSRNGIKDDPGHQKYFKVSNNLCSCVFFFAYPFFLTKIATGKESDGWVFSWKNVFSLMHMSYSRGMTIHRKLEKFYTKRKELLLT